MRSRTGHIILSTKRAAAAFLLSALFGAAIGCTSNIHKYLSELASTVPRSFDEGPVFTNPFGTAVNTYSVFFTYRGKIYVGPSPDGSYLVRFSPDGTDMETVSLSVTGISTTTSTMNPGPDSETGIDSFASGTIDGTEYLFIGPAKSSGDLNYLYYTSGSSTSLEFNYIDISGTLNPNTCGTESLIVYNNKLYAGYADNGSNRPMLVKISGVASPSITNTQARNMPRIGCNAASYANTASSVGIDFLREFNGLLFGANGGAASSGHDGGIVSSTNNDPGNYNGSPTDWNTTLTPAGTTEWDAGFSIELTKMNGLTPADRAFPAADVFNGVLYIARNTTIGLQIWAYNGSAFSLVAGGATYLSNMGHSSNTGITLLAVNGDRLYVGYDNATDGIRIYRTVSGVTAPSSQSDFEQVSSGGLGNPGAITRIFHAASVSDGGTAYLWVLCGKSGGDMYVFRTGNR